MKNKVKRVNKINRRQENKGNKKKLNKHVKTKKNGKRILMIKCSIVINSNQVLTLMHLKIKKNNL